MLEPGAGSLRQTNCRRSELVAIEPVPRGELRVCALELTVRRLQRTKQLFFHPIRGVLVELLIHLAEHRERAAELSALVATSFRI